MQGKLTELLPTLENWYFSYPGYAAHTLGEMINDHPYQQILCTMYNWTCAKADWYRRIFAGHETASEFTIVGKCFEDGEWRLVLTGVIEELLYTNHSWVAVDRNGFQYRLGIMNAAELARKERIGPDGGAYTNTPKRTWPERDDNPEFTEISVL